MPSSLFLFGNVFDLNFTPELGILHLYDEGQQYEWKEIKPGETHDHSHFASRFSELFSFTFLSISVLRSSPGFFSQTTSAKYMVERNGALPTVNKRPSADCGTTFPHTALEEASTSLT